MYRRLLFEMENVLFLSKSAMGPHCKGVMVLQHRQSDWNHIPDLFGHKATLFHFAHVFGELLSAAIAFRNL